MTRVAIVLFSTVGKYQRLDPGFYLEDPALLEDERRAVEGVRKAVARLRRIRQAIRENRAQVAAMQASSEVIPG